MACDVGPKIIRVPSPGEVVLAGVTARFPEVSCMIPVDVITSKPSVPLDVDALKNSVKRAAQRITGLMPPVAGICSANLVGDLDAICEVARYSCSVVCCCWAMPATAKADAVAAAGVV